MPDTAPNDINGIERKIAEFRRELESLQIISKNYILENSELKRKLLEYESLGNIGFPNPFVYEAIINFMWMEADERLATVKDICAIVPFPMQVVKRHITAMVDYFLLERQSNEDVESGIESGELQLELERGFVYWLLDNAKKVSYCILELEKYLLQSVDTFMESLKPRAENLKGNYLEVWYECPVLGLSFPRVLFVPDPEEIPLMRIYNLEPPTKSPDKLLLRDWHYSFPESEEEAG